MLKRFLFPKNPSHGISFGLLLLRLGFGLSMAVLHGWDKLIHFSEKSEAFNAGFFPGAFVLVVFAEFFCALGVAFGVLARLAVVPMIINMLVAMFGTAAFNELGLLYLTVYTVILICGSG